MFPTDPLVLRVELAFGADRTQHPDTWVWTDVTSRWHVPGGLRVRTGRRDGAVQAEAGEISLSLKNGDGVLSPLDPRSPHWPHWDEGCPIRVTIDPEVPDADPLTFAGFVASLRPRWPGNSAGLSLVDVVASGLLRQRGRGSPPLRSALYRWVMAQDPLPAAYWPLTEQWASTTARSATGGSAVARLSGRPPQWGQGDIGAWMPPGVRLESDGDTDSVIAGTFTTGDTWAVEAVIRPEEGTARLEVRGTSTDGTTHMWQVDADPTFDRLLLTYLYDSEAGGGGGPVGSFPAPSLFDGRPHVLRWEAAALPTDMAWSVVLDGVVVASGTGGVASTPVAPHSGHTVRLYAVGVAGTRSVVDAGHILAWDGIPDPAAVAQAALGYAGETAVDRVMRLCAEENLPLAVVGDGEGSTLMGPQRPATLVELLQECELAEDGILSEAGLGLGFRSRASRYNQPPALLVDMALRQLGADWEPTRDDQRLRNQVTVERTGGQQVTAVDAADQARRGVREDSHTINLASDSQLPDQAHWRLAQASTPSLRYPRLTLPLHTAPELAAQVLTLQPGDRVQVLHPPPQHPPGPIDQVVEGIEHEITGRRSWRVHLTVSPAEPWMVGVVGPDEGPAPPDAPVRYDTAGSQAVGSFEAGADTELLVATTHGPTWTTDPSDLPLDIQAAGAQLRVISIGPGLADDFQASATDGWGQTSLGGLPWITLGGAPGDYGKGSGVATMVETDAGGPTRRALLDGMPADLEVLWAVSVPEVSSGVAAQAGLLCREHNDNQDFIAFRLVLLTNGNVDARISIRQAGVETTLANPPSVQAAYGPGTVLWARCRAAGAQLLMRCWADGDPEPATWQVTAVDPAFAGVGGRAGLRAALDPGWTGTLPLAFSFHHFEVVSIQRMLVEQAPINGVGKSIPAGSAVSLWTPARRAL